MNTDRIVLGEYAYNAFGRRVKKIASGVTTLYHYAGGNLIAETDENGISQRDYIYLNGEPAALRIYGAQFGTMYYFVNDHLGTPQKIVDSTGQVVWAAAYLPFGKAQIKPETVTNNLRFPGQYSDAESGLHYNRNRYYDPDTGRYITADPIGLSGGINLYRYVSNNPVNLLDPYGLWRVWGNWCGSNWTGGFDRPWDELTDRQRRLAALPTDSLDECCRTHDMAYGDECRTGCRNNRFITDPCAIKKCESDCKNRADEALYSCCSRLPSDGRLWPRPTTNPDANMYRILVQQMAGNLQSANRHAQGTNEYEVGKGISPGENPPNYWLEWNF